MKTGMGLHKSFFPKSKKKRSTSTQIVKSIIVADDSVNLVDVLAAEFITTYGTKAVIDG